MAAAGNGFFDRQMAAVAGDGRVGSYFGSSGHGFVHFVQAAAGATSAAGVAVPDVGSLDAGGAIGMASASYAAAAGPVLPLAIAAPPQPCAGANGEAAVPFKGAWTKEEDEILREMVRAHGDRKWAAIARYLPGRIGKQCRERWINHLLPGIKKDVWTEEEDRALIEAHRSCGNRWSVIARHLPGRSENSVKNHWNATKRGLKSKRRLKKKNGEQAPTGQQVSLLAEYIRSLCPGAAAGSSTAAPPPASLSSAPPSDDRGYGTGLGAGPDVPAATVPGMGMYYHNDPGANMVTADLNVPSSALPDFCAAAYGCGMPAKGRYSYYLPSFAQFNLHYAGLRVPRPLPLQVQPPQMISAQDVLHAAAYANMGGYPFADQNLAAGNLEVEYDRESSTNQGNAGGGGYGYYYGYGGAAGPSSAAGGGGDAEEMEVVQMASREFPARDQDVVTLDLTRFK